MPIVLAIVGVAVFATIIVLLATGPDVDMSTQTTTTDAADTTQVVPAPGYENVNEAVVNTDATVNGNTNVSTEADATRDEKTYCLKDADCNFFCLDCFAKAYKTTPPGLLCATYGEGYRCSCINNKCQTVKQ